MADSKRRRLASRTKGYSRKNPAVRESLIAAKPAETYLTGVVGAVPQVWRLIDDRLRDRNWNWVTLAREIPCTRQYLERLTDQPSMPAELFLRICAILEIDPHKVIRRDSAVIGQ